MTEVISRRLDWKSAGTRLVLAGSVFATVLSIELLGSRSRNATHNFGGPITLEYLVLVYSRSNFDKKRSAIAHVCVQVFFGCYCGSSLTK